MRVGWKKRLIIMGDCFGVNCAIWGLIKCFYHFRTKTATSTCWAETTKASHAIEVTKRPAAEFREGVIWIPEFPRLLGGGQVGNACTWCQTAMAKPPQYVVGTASSEGSSCFGCHLERSGGSGQDDVPLLVACVSGVNFGNGFDVPGRWNGHNW